jgi:hypothetical protein
MKIGIEIEFFAPISKYELATNLRNQGIAVEATGYTHSVSSDWKIVDDGSVYGMPAHHGMELVSPILNSDSDADMASIGSTSSDAFVDTDSDSTREVLPQLGRSSASTRVVSVGSAMQGYDDVELSGPEAPCRPFVGNQAADRLLVNWTLVVVEALLTRWLASDWR